MIVYTLLGVTLMLALTSLLLAAGAMRRGLQHSWSSWLLSCSMAAFIYLYGAWIYLSAYCKYAFGVLFLLVLLAGVRRKRTAQSERHSRFALLHVAISMLFMACVVLYFTGTTGKPETVALDFPLKKARYFVLQGGKGLPSNLFHYSYRGAVYAIDIVQLDRYGRRASKVFSPRLEDYYIFADTVYSPCDGVVAMARDENPDNIPPDRTRGPSNTNSILIETDSFYVFMAHLKYRNVFVHEGEKVAKGQPLALAGNSGFSLEPHLHIQAHKKTGTGPWYREDPLYILFDGRSYLLFETVTPRKVEMQTK